MNIKTFFSSFVLATTLSVFVSNASADTLSKNKLSQYLDKCIPHGYHSIVEKIIAQESSYNPYAINVNGAKLNRQPKNINEAKKLIRQLVKNGYNFDIGLGGINSQHFKRNRFFGKLGYKPLDALNPCVNLKMVAAILNEAYERTGSLIEALSIYNTGDKFKGLKNGYVQSVLGK